MSDADTLPFYGVLDSPPALRWHGHPSEDWESLICAPTIEDLRELERGHLTHPGHQGTPADRLRIRESERAHRAQLERERKRLARQKARRERVGLRSEPPKKKEYPVISLAQFVEQGKAELERAAEMARVAQAAIDAAEAERRRQAELALAHRKAAWAKRGRAGLVADLTAVGWKVDAGDLRRLVLRRGEAEIALTLPFSPADACELEDRHGWAFLPWF